MWFVLRFIVCFDGVLRIWLCYWFELIWFGLIRCFVVVLLVYVFGVDLLLLICGRICCLVG